MSTLLPENIARISDANVLAAAEIIYWHRGVLPLNIVADLMGRGFEMDRLEAQWDATQQEAI